MHHDDQTRLRVASPFTHQNRGQRGLARRVRPGTSIPRRRSSATAWPYIGGWVIDGSCPSPEIDRHLRIELVAHVGNEAGTVLEFEDAPELGDRPIRPVEVGPDQGVETESQSHNQGYLRIRCGVAMVRAQASSIRRPTDDVIVSIVMSLSGSGMVDDMAVCAFVSFRLGLTDGVSVVTGHWQRAVESMGFDTVTVAGEGPVDRTVAGLELAAANPPDLDELRAACRR